MKTLRVLLLLIPILAVVMILACMLDLNVVFQVCMSGLPLALFAAGIWAVCQFSVESKKQFATPVGWYEAQTLYPPREIAGGEQARCFVRESGQGRFFLCRLRFNKDGMLITDAQPFLSFGKLFVPWEALEEPREIDLPWHATYASLWWREVVMGSGIRGTNLTLVVPKVLWFQEFAPHVTGE